MPEYRLVLTLRCQSRVISQKDRESKGKIDQVKEEFKGNNLTHFGGSGLIRGFFKRHKIWQNEA